jgi:large subunit ribosomal protein L32
MACPKKKTSKSKTAIRKAVWKRQAVAQAAKAISMGKSILTGNSKGFIYPLAEEDDEE